MRRLMMSTAAALALATLSAPAFAAEQWAFDKSHTHILYEVSHMGYSLNVGEFLEFDGSVTIDRENLANSAVEVTIDAKSLDSGFPARDEHVLNADFLDTDNFPTMTFTSTKVEPTGDTTAKVTGDLTVRGVTKPVTLDVTLRGEGENPFNGTPIMGFSATGVIDRTDFGMTYAPEPIVGHEVTIRIETELNPAQ